MTDYALEIHRTATWPVAHDSLSWDVAYPRYRRLLLGALSQLAMRGYHVPPDEGVDLVHSFFLEAWGRVVARFDPTRSKFETYLYGSFVSFARPRIINLARWRDTLVAPEELARLESPEFQMVASQEAMSDATTLRRAMATLSPLQHSLLAAYLSDLEPTERELALRFALSRHQLRQHLADALGEIVVSLGEAMALQEPDLSISLALWRDGRSIKETSQLMQMPASVIQASRSHMYKRLVLAVKGSQRMETMSSEDVAVPTNVLATAQALLLAAMQPEAVASHFEALQENADTVLQFIEDPMSGKFFAAHADELTPQVLARIYSSLSSPEFDHDLHRATEMRPFLEALEQEERSVGEAFSTTLLPTLPKQMKEFSGLIFLGAPRIEAAEHQHLLNDPSVISGGSAAAELAMFGITPVTILEAAQAVANVTRRICRSSGIVRGSSLILDTSGRMSGGSTPFVTREVAIQEIAYMTQLPRPTSERLFDWLAKVAGWVPHLFPWFDTQLWGDKLRLTRTDEVEDDLFMRWWKRPEPKAA